MFTQIVGGWSCGACASVGISIIGDCLPERLPWRKVSLPRVQLKMHLSLLVHFHYTGACFAVFWVLSSSNRNRGILCGPTILWTNSIPTSHSLPSRWTASPQPLLNSVLCHLAFYCNAIDTPTPPPHHTPIQFPRLILLPSLFPPLPPPPLRTPGSVGHLWRFEACPLKAIFLYFSPSSLPPSLHVVSSTPNLSWPKASTSSTKVHGTFVPLTLHLHNHLYFSVSLNQPPSTCFFSFTFYFSLRNPPNSLSLPFSTFSITPLGCCTSANSP